MENSDHMARKARVEIEGGHYHVITRGNHCQDIFHSRGDHLKFLSLLAKQKERSPFYLYAYCQMTNHVHRATRAPANLPSIVAIITH